MTQDASLTTPIEQTITLGELVRAFTRIGFLSFGGPAAQIALMHSDLVERRKWIGEQEFLSALSFCMLLPGPEAMQLATWIGWRKHGTLGGLIAGGLFVIPGAVIVLILSVIYATYGEVPTVSAIFTGIQAAVIAVVIEALMRVSKRALKLRAHWAIAILAFVALFAFAVPFPVVIGAAGLWGYYMLGQTLPAGAPAQPDIGAVPRVSATLRTIGIWLAVWLVPLGVLIQFEAGILAEIGLFFSKLAMLTFGGAYAVLAWMTQEVVQQKEWLTITQMMHGLGLAETTPGPLILVTEFVGFMAAHRQGGITLGLAGAAVTLWMTFAPCFLWIFAGAPWLAQLTRAPRLSAALAAITAAVVGVIANLSLWFAFHALYKHVERFDFGIISVQLPVTDSFMPVAALITVASCYLLLRLHLPILWVLLFAAGLAGLSTVV
jgi:chromate transporter